MQKVSKLLYIGGINSVEAQIIKAPDQIIEIIFNAQITNERIRNLILLSDELRLRTKFLSNFEFEKIDKTNNQGVICLIKPLNSLNEQHLFQEKSNFISGETILILDSIQDPMNLGAALRTASACNLKTVVINKDGSTKINQYVYKSSVGAILDLNIFYVTNLSRIIEKLKENDYWIVGLDGKSERDIFEQKFNFNIALVVGSEGSGIRLNVKKKCDLLVKIPMSSQTESLNMSVAAGISLYEIFRQKNY